MLALFSNASQMPGRPYNAQYYAGIIYKSLPLDQVFLCPTYPRTSQNVPGYHTGPNTSCSYVQLILGRPGMSWDVPLDQIHPGLMYVRNRILQPPLHIYFCEQVSSL